MKAMGRSAYIDLGKDTYTRQPMREAWLKARGLPLTPALGVKIRSPGKRCRGPLGVFFHCLNLVILNHRREGKLSAGWRTSLHLIKVILA
jgi:hypothetical protein